jgi:hypothetical protein
VAGVIAKNIVNGNTFGCFVVEDWGEKGNYAMEGVYHQLKIHQSIECDHSFYVRVLLTFSVYLVPFRRYKQFFLLLKMAE